MNVAHVSDHIASPCSFSHFLLEQQKKQRVRIISSRGFERKEKLREEKIQKAVEQHGKRLAEAKDGVYAEYFHKQRKHEVHQKRLAEGRQGLDEEDVRRQRQFLDERLDQE